jgi:DNA-binding transcriptional regulator LsrR (DeoR family)
MTDPWHNTRTEALEYLELITNKRIKSIAFQYYILGYTLAEIGAEHGISYEQVRRLLAQGVDQIKETIAGL